MTDESQMRQDFNIEFILARDHATSLNGSFSDAESLRDYVWAIGYVVKEDDEVVYVLSGGCYSDGEEPTTSMQQDITKVLKATIEERRVLVPATKKRRSRSKRV
jgi:hypothetical protein